MSNLEMKEGGQNYTLMLLVSGAALIVSGSTSIASGWVLVWYGFGCVLVGLGYLGLGAGIFGKQADGSRSWINRLILCPFLLLSYVLWHLHQFSATAQVRKLNYICVPTLDGYAPGDEDFGKLISKLSASSEEVYIHCAAGHGRSAAIAVALLVGRGLASDLTEAETTVKAKRPLISIKQPQRELLYRWFAARPQNGAAA